MSNAVRQAAYNLIEGHDYCFPVVGYDRRSLTPAHKVDAKNVYGTAFSIGDNCYITAGHSIKAAATENEVIGIAFVWGSDYVFVEAVEHEEISEIDIGLIRTMGMIKRAKAFKWEPNRIPSLAPVITTGYPFAITNGTIQTRAFQGYIVSRRPFEASGTRPWVYELSFASPVGLSGAPLVAMTHELRVAGIIYW